MTNIEQHMRRIILGLFNPMPDGHAKGCLVHDPHIKPRGPCICAYGEVAGEYLWALREAKKIAADHFGKQEVESAPRLKEPQQLVDVAVDINRIANAVEELADSKPPALFTTKMPKGK